MQQNPNKVIKAVLITLIAILAIFLRFYKVGPQMAFTYDQSRDMLDLSKIASGKLMLTGPTTGLHGVFLGPYYYYVLLPGFLLGQGSPIVVQYWETGLLTLSLILGYLVIKELSKKDWVNITGLFVLAVVPGSLIEARMLWNPYLAVPTLLLSIWLLFKSQKKAWLLIPAMFIFGLSWQTELAYAVFLTPAFFYWIFKHSPIWKKTSQSLYSWKLILLATLALGATLLPQALFELKHDFIMTKSLQRALQETTQEVGLVDVWQRRPTEMAGTLKNRLFGQDQDWLGSSLFILTLLFSTWTLAQKSQTNREKFVGLLTILPIAAMMIQTANGGNYFEYYLAPHYLMFVLLLVIWLNKISGKKQQVFSLAVVSLYGMIALHQAINIQRDQYLFNISHQIKALLYARQHRTTDNYAIEVFVPNLQPQNYQYLNYWLAKSGQTTAADFFRDGHHQEYFLMWEPAAAGGSELAYKEWRQRHTTDATCRFEHQQGIISIERCQKN
ncbi:MAG: hypothetical protein ACOZAN_02075 [Patescibacteria group bacterium]